MANTHNVFEPKQMASVNVDSLVRSVVLASDVDNGTAVVLGVQPNTIFGEVEIGTYAATLASAQGDIISIIDGDGNSLLEGYDVGLVDPRGAYNPANKVTRARFLFVNDEFMIQTAAINGTFGSQGYVVVDTTGGQEGKFELIDNPAGYAFIGKIINRAVPILFGNTKVDFTLIRVIRNSNDSAIAVPFATDAASGGIIAAAKGVGDTVVAKKGDDNKLYVPTYPVLPVAATVSTAGIVLKAATQADSVAADVAAMVVDFNALLAKLKAAGLVATA
jgi:hypothetical protein